VSGPLRLPPFANGSRKGYVDVGLGQMHYRELGDGFPLILLHQSPSSSAMWEPVLPGLAAGGFRALAFDLPGFGMSTAFEQPPSIENYACAVFEALDQLAIDAFHVLGHHTGAAVAIDMAATSSRVQKLALWGPCLFDPDKRARLVAERPPVFDDDGDNLRMLWQRRRLIGGPKFTPHIGVRFMAEVLLTGDHRPWGHWAAGQFDTGRLLPRLTQQVLFLSGEYDTQWQETRRAADLVRNSRSVSIAGASMDVADEFPSEFVDAVLHFLSDQMEEQI
jgi:pimeloyl-ACP methyl ester carboxylesterase